MSIIATVLVRFDKEYDCNTCKLAASAKRDGMQRRERKGCFTAQSHAIYSHKRKINFYKCPANYYSSYVSSLLDSYIDSAPMTYQEKIKLPSKLVEVFNLLDNLVNEQRLKNVERSTGNANARRKGSN
jgi:hypothetical protein